jgi:FkbM family methyltransferase
LFSKVVLNTAQRIGFKMNLLLQKNTNVCDVYTANLRAASFQDRFFCWIYRIYKLLFERSEIKFFKKIIKPGDVILDIGAGLGIYTEIFSDLTGSEGKVYSFEPEVLNYSRCTRLVSKSNLSNIELDLAAVSNQNGSRSLSIDRNNPVNHSFETISSDLQRVETLRIDSRFKNNLEVIKFCKIDVQGHELEVLEGAHELLSIGNCNFVIEFDSNYGYKKLEKLWIFLHKYHYKGYEIKSKGRIERCTEYEPIETYRNLFFSKNNHDELSENIYV